MTHQHTQHSTNFTLIIRWYRVAYITRVYLLVCKCVINKYSILAVVNNNTPTKNRSVLVPCSVLPVQFTTRPFRGCTNVQCPRNMILATGLILLNTCFVSAKESFETICNKIIYFFLVLLLLDDNKSHIRITLLKSVWRYKYWITKSIVGRLEPSLARREDLKKETNSFSLLIFKRGGLCEHNFTNRKRTSKRVKCIAL